MAQDPRTAIDAELDPKVQPDSNLQHLRHMFEGYRAHTMGLCGNPYSHGSARGESWAHGWSLAEADKDARGVA